MTTSRDIEIAIAKYRALYWELNDLQLHGEQTRSLQDEIVDEMRELEQLIGFAPEC